MGDDMLDEIELKFLGIDKEEMERKLATLGAEKKFTSDSRAIYFDGPGVSATDHSKMVVRLRTMDGKHVLTWKRRRPDTEARENEELETEVGDFATAQAILERLGYRPGLEIEKRRTHYELGEAHFELDEIPGEKPYLEIETHSVEGMRAACAKLGLRMEDGSTGTVQELFPERFKVLR